MPAEARTIAIVRGLLDGDRADKIVSFLSREGGLNDQAARRWASEAVCVELDGGEIVGVGSVRSGSLQLVGGRPFWIYQSVLAQDSDERWDRMFSAAFEVLSREFEESRSHPVGVCVVIGDSAVIRRRSEAVWPDTELMLAGYLEDDRQVRLRYFWGAEIGPGYPESPPIDVSRHHTYPLEELYRIQSLAESTEVAADDVLRLWAREGAVPEAEATGRVREVQLVATERDEGVVGISSLYLQHNHQLRMDLWHYRTYVARAHRKSNVAAQLIFSNRDLVEERYVRGDDTRAAGVLFELENDGLKRYFNKALWLPADFTFIGENERGDHVRVHYFPGARVPMPRPATGDSAH